MSLCFNIVVNEGERVKEKGREKEVKGFPKTRDAVVAAVRSDGMALAWAGEWRYDPEVIWTAINNDGRSIAFVPKDSPCRTPELCEAAVAQTWRAVLALDYSDSTDAVCKIVRGSAEVEGVDLGVESVGVEGVGVESVGVEGVGVEGVGVEAVKEVEEESQICHGDQACVCVCCWGARECAEQGGNEGEVEDEENEENEEDEEDEEEYEYKEDYWNDW